MAFDVARAAQACVTVRNGRDRPRRIASADVRLDSRPLLGPSRFNQNVALVEERVDLAAGSHELTAELRSAPGAFVEIEIRIAEPPTADQLSAREELRELEVLLCQQTNFGASQLTDEQRQAFRVGAQKVAAPPGRMIVVPGAYGTPGMMMPLPQEDLDDASSTAAAVDWLDRHRGIFLASHAQLTFVPRLVQTDLGGNDRVWFRQHWQGVPVYPGDLDLRVDDGWVVRMHGSVVPASRLPPSVVPAVAESPAVQAAREALALTEEWVARSSDGGARVRAPMACCSASLHRRCVAGLNGLVRSRRTSSSGKSFRRSVASGGRST